MQGGRHSPEGRKNVVSGLGYLEATRGPKNITSWIMAEIKYGILVTPTPQIRTLQPAHDSHRILVFGGCAF